LLYSPEGWLLEDLQSTNGTFVNGLPLQPGQPLQVSAGDVIRCAQLTLVFYEE
jgi:pSer/pThr/pTyr-binding forkhead associated (FHA) protein